MVVQNLIYQVNLEIVSITFASKTSMEQIFFVNFCNIFQNKQLNITASNNNSIMHALSNCLLFNVYHQKNKKSIQLYIDKNKRQIKQTKTFQTQNELKTKINLKSQQEIGKKITNLKSITQLKNNQVHQFQQDKNVQKNQELQIVSQVVYKQGFIFVQTIYNGRFNFKAIQLAVKGHLQKINIDVKNLISQTPLVFQYSPYFPNYSQSNHLTQDMILSSHQISQNQQQDQKKHEDLFQNAKQTSFCNQQKVKKNNFIEISNNQIDEKCQSRCIFRKSYNQRQQNQNKSKSKSPYKGRRCYCCNQNRLLKQNESKLQNSFYQKSNQSFIKCEKQKVKYQNTFRDNEFGLRNSNSLFQQNQVRKKAYSSLQQKKTVKISNKNSKKNVDHHSSLIVQQEEYIQNYNQKNLYSRRSYSYKSNQSHRKCYCCSRIKQNPTQSIFKIEHEIKLKSNHATDKKQFSNNIEDIKNQNLICSSRNNIQDNIGKIKFVQKDQERNKQTQHNTSVNELNNQKKYLVSSVNKKFQQKEQIKYSDKSIQNKIENKVNWSFKAQQCSFKAQQSFKNNERLSSRGLSKELDKVKLLKKDSLNYSIRNQSNLSKNQNKIQIQLQNNQKQKVNVSSSMMIKYPILIRSQVQSQNEIQSKQINLKSSESVKQNVGTHEIKGYQQLKQNIKQQKTKNQKQLSKIGAHQQVSNKNRTTFNKNQAINKNIFMNKTNRVKKQSNPNICNLQNHSIHKKNQFTQRDSAVNLSNNKGIATCLDKQITDNNDMYQSSKKILNKSAEITYQTNKKHNRSLKKEEQTIFKNQNKSTKIINFKDSSVHSSYPIKNINTKNDKKQPLIKKTSIANLLCCSNSLIKQENLNQKNREWDNTPLFNNIQQQKKLEEGKHSFKQKLQQESIEKSNIKHQPENVDNNFRVQTIDILNQSSKTIPLYGQVMIELNASDITYSYQIKNQIFADKQNNFVDWQDNVVDRQNNEIKNTKLEVQEQINTKKIDKIKQNLVQKTQTKHEKSFNIKSQNNLQKEQRQQNQSIQQKKEEPCAYKQKEQVQYIFESKLNKQEKLSQLKQKITNFCCQQKYLAQIKTQDISQMNKISENLNEPQTINNQNIKKSEHNQQGQNQQKEYQQQIKNFKDNQQQISYLNLESIKPIDFVSKNQVANKPIFQYSNVNLIQNQQAAFNQEFQELKQNTKQLELKADCQIQKQSLKQKDCIQIKQTQQFQQLQQCLHQQKTNKLHEIKKESTQLQTIQHFQTKDLISYEKKEELEQQNQIFIYGTQPNKLSSVSQSKRIQSDIQSPQTIDQLHQSKKQSELINFKENNQSEFMKDEVKNEEVSIAGEDKQDISCNDRSHTSNSQVKNTQSNKQIIQDSLQNQNYSKNSQNKNKQNEKEQKGLFFQLKKQQKLTSYQQNVQQQSKIKIANTFQQSKQQKQQKQAQIYESNKRQQLQKQLTNKQELTIVPQSNNQLIEVKVKSQNLLVKENTQQQIEQIQNTKFQQPFAEHIKQQSSESQKEILQKSQKKICINRLKDQFYQNTASLKQNKQSNIALEQNQSLQKRSEKIQLIQQNTKDDSSSQNKLFLQKIQTKNNENIKQFDQQKCNKELIIEDSDNMKNSINSNVLNTEIDMIKNYVQNQNNKENQGTKQFCSNFQNNQNKLKQLYEYPNEQSSTDITTKNKQLNQNTQAKQQFKMQSSNKQLNQNEQLKCETKEEQLDEQQITNKIYQKKETDFSKQTQDNYNNKPQQVLNINHLQTNVADKQKQLQQNQNECKQEQNQNKTQPISNQKEPLSNNLPQQTSTKVKKQVQTKIKKKADLIIKQNQKQHLNSIQIQTQYILDNYSASIFQNNQQKEMNPINLKNDQVNQKIKINPIILGKPQIFQFDQIKQLNPYNKQSTLSTFFNQTSLKSSKGFRQSRLLQCPVYDMLICSQNGHHLLQDTVKQSSTKSKVEQKQNEKKQTEEIQKQVEKKPSPNPFLNLFGNKQSNTSDTANISNLLQQKNNNKFDELSKLMQNLNKMTENTDHPAILNQVIRNKDIKLQIIKQHPQSKQSLIKTIKQVIKVITKYFGADFLQSKLIHKQNKEICLFINQEWKILSYEAYQKHLLENYVSKYANIDTFDSIKAIQMLTGCSIKKIQTKHFKKKQNEQKLAKKLKTYLQTAQNKKQKYGQQKIILLLSQKVIGVATKIETYKKKTLQKEQNQGKQTHNFMSYESFKLSQKISTHHIQLQKIVNQIYQANFSPKIKYQTIQVNPKTINTFQLWLGDTLLQVQGNFRFILYRQFQKDKYQFIKEAKGILKYLAPKQKSFYLFIVEPCQKSEQKKIYQEQKEKLCIRYYFRADWQQTWVDKLIQCVYSGKAKSSNGGYQNQKNIYLPVNHKKQNKEQQAN